MKLTLQISEEMVVNLLYPRERRMPIEFPGVYLVLRID